MTREQRNAARYWLIWAKATAEQMPKNKGIDTTTYHSRGYRDACNAIALAMAEKLEEIEEGGR